MSQFLSCALLAINIATRFASFPPALCNCIASLQHVCRIFAASLRSYIAFLFCRIFATSLLHVLGAFWPFASLPHLWLHQLLLVCFAGRTWLLAATPGFTELHKAQHYPQCPSSKTSICERFICSKNTIFQTCAIYKNKVCPKMTILQNAPSFLLLWRFSFFRVLGGLAHHKWRTRSHRIGPRKPQSPSRILPPETIFFCYCLKI